MKKNIPVLAKRSDCAISMGLDTVGDKWSLLILRDLMFKDKHSYGELQSCEEKIATNILASRLINLEENGIIRKQQDPADNRRSLYYLTEKGIQLLPVIIELMQWTAKHNPGASDCASSSKAYKENRIAFYEEMMEKIRKEHLK